MYNSFPDVIGQCTIGKCTHPDALIVNVFMVFTVEDTSTRFSLDRVECLLLTVWVLGPFLGLQPLRLYLFTMYTIPPRGYNGHQ